MLYAFVKSPIKALKALELVFEMNNEIKVLYAAHVIRQKSGFFNGEKFVHFMNHDQGNNRIRELLTSDRPVLIARHGGTELVTVCQYDLDNGVPGVRTLCSGSGFFPCYEELAKKWSKLYLESLPGVDCLCEWNHRFGKYGKLQHMFSKYTPAADIINNINVLTPFFDQDPWTIALKGKRVLVIHPFANTIKAQYEKRELLFDNPNVLPEFEKLETIKTVVNITGNPVAGYNTWFEAYDDLKQKIAECEFDVALLGCASYGLITASYIKSLGKSAVHIGGGLQLLFGIRGHRWDSAQDWIDRGLYNEHWVRPSEEETPGNAKNLEEAAYW